MSEKLKLKGNLKPLVPNCDLNGYFEITKKLDLPSVLFKNKVFFNDFDTSTTTPDKTIFLQKNKPLLAQGKNIYSIDNAFSYLNDGDIILIKEQTISVAYRKNANATFLLLTEQCDNFCIMCSQPPKAINDEYIVDQLMELIPLLPKSLHEIGLTGGEPTILGNKFIKILNLINAYLPNTSVHVLSNGKSFSDDFLKKISERKHYDLMFGIPLYSHNYETHDYIVQSKNAFNETVEGIINLKRFQQKVEIRVVIQKNNYKDLPDLANFILRNLQFVDQVVFMGLEMTGFARGNASDVWVEPSEYQSYLKEAITTLSRAKVRCRIYNHQLCILDRSLWEYNVSSISDWKNNFISECENCLLRSSCGGFFATSDNRLPQKIKAFK
ncbi:His-Xaa-Ser system radical SAM maturase HxsC [Psychromonas aquatilis]|uniref:His-Xaa-Ser system radical SAM maturase HxsC n=1 Tax=Psychromonas aquatilis TaxID=2005072 RepID=A0ABU9GTS3_9GAMM